jgi:hypothetical protein
LLTLTYIPEDEWHGELHVAARYASFSGKASAWFNADALLAFAEPLKSFPPKLEEPVTLNGGYFSDSTTSAAPVETHVGLRIEQLSPSGRYRVTAQLAEPSDDILPQSAAICFQVETYALMRFSEELKAIIASGGSVTLPASGGSEVDSGLFNAPCPIIRPYTPLFMTLREQCSAVIEQMDEEAAEIIRVAISYEEAAAWQAISPHEIIAQIDWDHDCINLAWVEWNGEAWAEGEPETAAWSPTYSLDLTALKTAALAAARPCAWFESYALYILSTAQDYLIEFYRDGPTDDIPYRRHLLYARGTARTPAPVWVKHVMFRYDDH